MLRWFGNKPLQLGGFSELKAVILHDRETGTSIIRDNLRAMGLTAVKEVADGVDCLEAVRKSKPQVIFIDSETPSVEVDKLVAPILKIDPETGIIVLLPEKMAREGEPAILPKGVFASLRKPISISDLIALVTNFTQK